MPSASSVTLIPLTFQKRVLVRDVLVVGRMDEDRDVDRLAVGGERVARHLADVEAPVVDRRADAERAQRGRLQHELPARLVRDDRRIVEREEERLALARLARLEADVVAREQRAEPGHAAQRDARLDDPELRVRDHEARRVLGDLGLDQHLGVILGELDRRDDADPDVLVPDERLAGLDALAPSFNTIVIVGPSLLMRWIAMPIATTRGEQRNDPDDRDPDLLLPRDHGLRQMVEIGLVSHGGPGAGRWRPR